MKKYNITVNGTTYAVEVEEAGGSAAPAAAPALYRGEDTVLENGIEYRNVEAYLKEL